MPKVTVDLEFEPGDFVMLKTDRKDKFVRLVKAWSVSGSGIQYELNHGATSSWHYGFEMEKTEEPKVQVGFAYLK